jgi:Tol biopolymer transport system component
VIYQSAGWISQARISPDGRHVAFADHPTRNSDSGIVALVDRKGERRTLSDGWGTLRGLAWTPDGSEVWFTADRGGAARGLYAVSLDGTLRRVLQLASNMTVYDIARDGRVLVGHGPERAGINGLAPGETRERDLSWLDWSLLKAISLDGRTLLIDETAEGGGQSGSVYLRPMDGSPAIRLGDGAANAMSSDGQWVIASFFDRGASRLVMLPTGVGESRAIPSGTLYCHHAVMLPDNRHLVVSAHESGQGIRLYRLDSETGAAQTLSPEGVNATEFYLLPGGDAVAALTADQEYWLYPLQGGDPRALTALERTDRIVRWLPDGRGVLVFRTNELPARMHRVDLESGERTVVRVLAPPDPTGIYRVGRVHTSADGAAYAYNYYMQLIDLHVVSGLR